MWTMGQQAAPAAFEPQSRRLIRGYLAHLRSRAEVGERKRDADLADYVPGTFAAIPDGFLAVGREGATWSLWLEWNGEYGRRQLASGTWEHVERCALDVAIHGPPGGPDLRGQGSSWRDVSGDGTLHLLTLGGDFRLMPLDEGRHILAFSRNDGPVRVLDIGDAEALQDAPGERHSNDVLHVSIGGERAELRGVCAAGVLGILEWYGGSRLLLGHLEGECFGLFFVRGREGRCIGLYDFDMLRRGDLGEVLAGVGHGLGERGGLGEGDVVGGDGRAAAQAQRAREPASQRPRPPPHQTVAFKSGPRPQVATPRPRQRKPAPPRAGLSPEEKQRIEDHLTVTEPKPATGSGATQVPKVFKGLRAHAARGGPTLLLRNCDLRSLLEGIEQEEAEGVEFHCCTKTFGRAVASAAEHTPMLEPVGKRWRVLGGDQLLEKLNASEDEPEASSTGAEPAPPAMEPQPVVEPPSSSTTPPEPAASSTTPSQAEPPASSTTPASSTAPPQAEPPASSTTPASSPPSPPRHSEPPASSTAGPEPVASQTPASPAQVPASPIEGQPAPAADVAGPSVPPQNELENRAITEWLLGKNHRSYRRIRPDDILRVSMASVDDKVSASRWPGKKPRDGP
jgi:hypothetical protein